jgi:hypothetical protein
VRSGEPGAVVRVLPLISPRPCSWAEGIRRAYDLQGVFATPALDGWTLAVGSLPEAGGIALEEILLNLSRAFGEACYFGTHRVVEYQAWARARAGTLERAFAYLGERGEFLVNLGARTADELELKSGIANLDDALDEEVVLSLATRWTLDPRQLEDRTDGRGPGCFAAGRGGGRRG